MNKGKYYCTFKHPYIYR